MTVKFDIRTRSPREHSGIGLLPQQWARRAAEGAEGDRARSAALEPLDGSQTIDDTVETESSPRWALLVGRVTSVAVVLSPVLWLAAAVTDGRPPWIGVPDALTDVAGMSWATGLAAGSCMIPLLVFSMWNGARDTACTSLSHLRLLGPSMLVLARRVAAGLRTGFTTALLGGRRTQHQHGALPPHAEAFARAVRIARDRGVRLTDVGDVA